MENLTIDAIRQNFWLSMIFASLLTSLFLSILNRFHFFKDVADGWIVIFLGSLATFFLTDFADVQTLEHWQDIGFKFFLVLTLAITVAYTKGQEWVDFLTQFITDIFKKFLTLAKNIFAGNENKQQSNNQ